jgi:hypothetical protein
MVGAGFGWGAGTTCPTQIIICLKLRSFNNLKKVKYLNERNRGLSPALFLRPALLLKRSGPQGGCKYFFIKLLLAQTLFF